MTALCGQSMPLAEAQRRREWTVETHSSTLPFFQCSTAFGYTPRYTFSTKEYLPAAGLYLYQYRVYDPIAGRWTQRDPIDYQDSLNLYQFCGNNPVNLHDADGKWTLTLAGGYGYAARVTIGHNGGQWHVGYGVGFGLGASIKYDPANQDPGPGRDGLAADMRVEASDDVDVGAASVGSSLGVARRTDSHNNNYTRIEVSGDVQMRSPDRCMAPRSRWACS